MKTLFKILVIGILLTAFAALTFAQEPTLAELVEKFRGDLKSPCGQRDAALVTGKTIVEKFGSAEMNKEVDNTEVIDYVKKKMALIETEDPRCKLNQRYDADYKAKNWANFLADSKEIIAAEGDTPLALDVMLTAVSIGYDRAAVDKLDTYNNDTLNYAKTALQKIEAGKTSKTGKWGVFVPFNTKENAQSWMNNIIGYLMYEKMNQKAEALPYFYKATQIGTENKTDVSIYVKIGTNYFDKAAALEADYRKAHTADKANNVEDTDATKKLLGLARGNADRGIDAFGRAYKIASATGSTTKPEAKAALLKTLTDLYKFRFNLPPDAKTPDLDSYVAGLTSKPMPDPASEVTPVVEEVKPATTTTTTTTTPTTTTPTTKPTTPTTKPTTTKPVTTTTTKPTTSSTTDGTTEATTTAKTKTPVKKPVTKKKGTR
ncbi:MAG: hypothetical protein ABJA66_09090 [Actinomycetota bacterium]